MFITEISSLNFVLIVVKCSFIEHVEFSNYEIAFYTIKKVILINPLVLTSEQKFNFSNLNLAIWSSLLK